MKISERDILIYQELLGDVGEYQEMITWSVNTPLELYETGKYKEYTGNYLRVIFGKVRDEINGTRSFGYEKFNFTGKDGERYAGEFDDREEPKDYDMEKIGYDHLKEFIDFYTYDLVVTYIQEGIEELEDRYRFELFSYLISASRFMGGDLKSLEGYKGQYFMDWKGYLMDTVQDSVDKYFETTGRQEDKYTNKWYRELQDRAMKANATTLIKMGRGL